ncbi:MAG: alpha-xylosidase [Blautia sp.]|nr:alpha-xylosidase [Blautia sp.]
MKFTEGYWLRNERTNGLFAMEAYYITHIPGGMRIVAPCAHIPHRGATLNMPAITMEFHALGDRTVHVTAWHYEGYENGAPEFEKNETITEPEVIIDETGAVMNTGLLTVRVNKYPFSYQFEADGKVLTSCDFRGLGLMRWDRKPVPMSAVKDYLCEDYQPYMLNELSLSVGECVYGFGERFSAFVKNGQSIETWNEDGGTASQIAYKSIPFYMTNRGYGVFVDSSDNVSYEVASEKVERVGFSVPGEKLSYYFFYGPSHKEILKEYTSLTGRPALPPAWSFGLWLSTSFTTDYDEKTTSSFIDGMLERDIPLSVFHFDCFWMKAFHWCDFEWDSDCFPDIRSTIKKYHEKGLKICCWINPYIAQGTEFFREGMKGGYLLQRSDGRGVWQTDNWQNGMGIVDFTNPDAVKWYLDKLRTVLDAGVDCFKTDFGERIPVDVQYFDGSDPYAMHNYYTFLYNKAVFGLLKEVKGENEAVLFARSATAGGQQFPVHWGGDCFASYPSMAETLRGGLSFAMSGFSFWSHDISGFESTATPDLYKRWAAFGLLSTHSRLHGSGSYRVPWLFDEEANGVVSFFTKLKCRLMPYIYAKAIEAHEEGTPVMRPMVFEYQDDPACTYLDRQYMLGESLLIAPVLSEDGIAEYYLPDGRWTHLLSGESKKGGSWYREKYDYYSFPLFVRENSLIAMGSVDTRPDYDYSKDINLTFYEPEEGSKAVCLIPSADGRIVNRITAEKTGGRVIMSSEETVSAASITIIENGKKRKHDFGDK